MAFEFTLLFSHFLTVYQCNIRKHFSVLFTKISARQLFDRASIQILPFLKSAVIQGHDETLSRSVVSFLVQRFDGG